MFDFETTTGLDTLGSRRRPTKWAVELTLAECRPQKHKQRRRQMQQAKEASEQQRQQQRDAAQRKQLALMQQQDPDEVTPAQAKYRKEFRDSNVVWLSTEIEQGNVEYKYKLTGCVTNENRRHQLVTQMKFRLSEGGGECFYYIGVEDDGYPRGLEPQELQASIAVIHRMANSLQATARLVEYVPGGFGRTAALLHIKANAEEDMRATDSRVAVAGSLDSGKSTLVAVLTHGSDGRPLLDNGRGSARMAVFRHKHEIESGRTSSISHQVLGYDEEGRVLNYVGVATPTPADITAAAAQMLNFIDMGGHEKYLKTTLYGMTCLLPDYALLCVDAVTGITRITREHLAVAVALEVPTALVVTKADAVDQEQLQQLLDQIRLLMDPVLSSSSSSITQQEQELQDSQQVQPLHAGQQQPQQHEQQQHGVQSMSATGRESLQEDQQQCADTLQSRLEEERLGSVQQCEGEGLQEPNGSSSLLSHASDSAAPSHIPAAVAAAPVERGVPVIQTETEATALAAKLSALHSCTAGPAGSSFQQVVFPVFVISCVTGTGLPLLHAFLSHLKPLQTHNQSSSSSSGDMVHQQAKLLSGLPYRAVAAAGSVAGKPDRQHEQEHAEVRPAPARDGSSQLWGIPEQAAAAAAAAAAAVSLAVTEQLETPDTSELGLAAAEATADAADVGEAGPRMEAAAAALPHASVSAAAGGGSWPFAGCPDPLGHFQVVHTYDVEGVGWVVSGIAVSGAITVGQSLLWGPTPEGGFSPVRVSCIQRSHVPVRQIAPGQTATLALQPVGPGMPPTSSKHALLTAAAVAQAAAAEAAAREAAAAIAAVPEPVAKTKRRSPAALKAAAAAAAHTAAAAAAAAAAARRAAETAEGKAWWMPVGQDEAQLPASNNPPPPPQQQQQQQQQQQDLPQQQLVGAPTNNTATVLPAASAPDSIADLLNDDFAAQLAMEDSSDESEVNLFEEDDKPRQRNAHQRGNSAAAAVDTGVDDLGCFDGLFGGDEDEPRQPVGRSSSSSSSSLSEAWSLGSSSELLGSSSVGLERSVGGGSSTGSLHHGHEQQTQRQQQQLRHQGGLSGRSRRDTIIPVPHVRSAAPAALGSCMAAAASPAGSFSFACSPSKWRSKGAVLLDAAAVPHTHWEFEALLVLLGGHWPPRGLVSGCWPPADQEAEGPATDSAPAAAAAETSAIVSAGQDRSADADARPEGGGGSGVPVAHAQDSSASTQQPPQAQAQRRGRKQLRRASKRYEFAYVIHCNSIRQIARVLSMRELQEQEEELSDDFEGSEDSLGPQGSNNSPAASSSSSSRSAATSSGTSTGRDKDSGQGDAAPLMMPCIRSSQHGGLTASIRAAAALLQGSQLLCTSAASSSSDKEGSSGCISADSTSGSSKRPRQQQQQGAVAAGSSRDGSSSRRGGGSAAGSVVAVRFRFTHRPEWMQVGARLIVRDRSDGHVAAAGFVTGLREPHHHQGAAAAATTPAGTAGAGLGWDRQHAGTPRPLSHLSSS